VAKTVKFQTCKDALRKKFRELSKVRLLVKPLSKVAQEEIQALLLVETLVEELTETLAETLAEHKALAQTMLIYFINNSVELI